LYYWEHDGGVAFASELRSLLTLPGFPRRLDIDAVAQYLAFGYVPESACIFEGVSKLPAGHFLTWNAGAPVDVQQYWSALRPERTDVSADEATEELRALLRESVQLHLESDVPVGAFLS